MSQFTPIDRIGIQTNEAYRILIINGLQLQALVVLFSAIDVMAWISTTNDYVTGGDFIRWVREYIDLKLLGCASEDLYSARCAILHTGTAQSKMTDRAEASRIFYAHTDEQKAAILMEADRRGEEVKVINPLLLLNLFNDGVLRFKLKLDTDVEQKSLFDSKKGKLLTYTPGDDF